MPMPRVSTTPEGRPAPKAQRNFTDPDSRIMKDGASKAFEQCYNGQAVVDDKTTANYGCNASRAAVTRVRRGEPCFFLHTCSHPDPSCC